MTVREHPIIFSGPMVRAILEDRKTQTRRVIKPVQPRDDGLWPAGRDPVPDCHYGQTGQRIWVREAHSIHNAHGQHRTDDKRWGPWGGLPTKVSPDGTQIAYFREGFDRCDPGRWRPSIHMPRWASRITLELTDVRVERLQDISYEDAIAEGIPDPATMQEFPHGIGDGETVVEYCRRTGFPQRQFRDLWDLINAKKYPWSSNPWVWALTFKRVEE